MICVLAVSPVKTPPPAPLNLYVYCGNNPMTNTDPTGLCEQEYTGAGSSISNFSTYSGVLWWTKWYFGYWQRCLEHHCGRFRQPFRIGALRTG